MPEIFVYTPTSCERRRLFCYKYICPVKGKQRVIRKNMAHTRQNYNKKIPDEKRIIRQHFRAMGERRRKAKMTFETEDDAWEFVNAHCLHGLVVYQCRFCGKYHIGHAKDESNEQTK